MEIGEKLTRIYREFNDKLRKKLREISGKMINYWEIKEKLIGNQREI